MPTREQLIAELRQLVENNGTVRSSLNFFLQVYNLSSIEELSDQQLRNVLNSYRDVEDVSSNYSSSVENPPVSDAARDFFNPDFSGVSAGFQVPRSKEQIRNEIRELNKQIELINKEISQLQELGLDKGFQVEPTIVEDQEFFDHAIRFAAPFDRKERQNLNNIIGANFVEVQPFYNFYVRTYESASQGQDVDERLLPNLYAFASELAAGNTDEQNSKFRQHITLNGTLKETFVDVVNSRGEKIGEQDKGLYFQSYARVLPRLRTGSADFIDLRNDFTKMGVPISNVGFLNNYNEKSNLFPMFFDIRFRTDNSTQFAEILSASNLSSVLMADIVDGKISPMERSFQLFQANLIASTGEATGAVSGQRVDAMIWDVEEWIDTLSTGSFSPLENGVFLGSYDKEIRQLNSPDFDFAKQLSILIFNGKLQRLVEREQRTYKEMLDGEVAYNETIFYEIEKRDATTGASIQRFFLPNSNTIDELRFIDTQVKYDKRYTYEIFAYQFILGNRYTYSRLEVGSQDATFRVTNRPSLKIARIPYYSFTGRIMDRPPVFPDLNVVSFRGVRDRLKFNLNSNVGTYKMMPQIILPSDQQVVDKLREAQQVGPNDPLTYRTDDRVAAFEVFRLQRRPRKFSDFQENKIATIITDVDGVSLQQASAASFIDDIQPNTKFYYVFRSIDVHGHISNPTPIYEVELIANDNAVYSSIRVVDFDDGSDQRTTTKSATRFIQVRPTFAQTILNEQKSGLIVDGERVKSIEGKRDFTLGVQDESVWNRRFKVRFVSRKTGRKIDLNLSFKQSRIKRVDNNGKVVDEGTST